MEIPDIQAYFLNNINYIRDNHIISRSKNWHFPLQLYKGLISADALKEDYLNIVQVSLSFPYK